MTKKKSNPTKRRGNPGTGFQGIRAGCAKEKVAKAFCAKGRQAAMTLAADLGIKYETAREWTGAWIRAGWDQSTGNLEVE